MLNTRRLSHVKRELFKLNIGGHESNPQINGANNQVLSVGEPEKGEPSTLLRKAGNQVGKILEGGTNIVIAPAKWLAHMQENWYILFVILYTDPLWRSSRCGFFLGRTDLNLLIYLLIVFL
jgi:hypothetical protein